MVYENVKAYCDRNELTIAKFEELCGFSNGTVGKWKRSEPKIKTLMIMAEKTGIPIEKWLINGKETA